jgi:hypothetical protein
MRALLFYFSALAIMIGASAQVSAALPMYRATPVTAPADGQIIVHDLAWRCASGSCTASRTGSSTDSTICSALARDLGPLTAFAVGDTDFDAAAIEKCNHRAR